MPHTDSRIAKAEKECEATLPRYCSQKMRDASSTRSSRKARTRRSLWKASSSSSGAGSSSGLSLSSQFRQLPAHPQPLWSAPRTPTPARSHAGEVNAGVQKGEKGARSLRRFLLAQQLDQPAEAGDPLRKTDAVVPHASAAISHVSPGDSTRREKGGRCLSGIHSRDLRGICLTVSLPTVAPHLIAPKPMSAPAVTSSAVRQKAVHGVSVAGIAQRGCGHRGELTWRGHACTLSLPGTMMRPCQCLRGSDGTARQLVG